jgi:hypothetical protein
VKIRSRTSRTFPHLPQADPARDSGDQRGQSTGTQECEHCTAIYNLFVLRIEVNYYAADSSYFRNEEAAVQNFR